MPKHALIVDDSPSARLVLGRLLARHGLAVEAAASAEEALEYLETARPDVVFMDHQMPGMDGLQALAAIKANPETATIPVMMYTSQEGEVYVGQARALGALGVLPKQVKPVEVSEILRSLHLIEDDVVPAAARQAPPVAGAPAPEALRELLADLFAQQRELLRNDLKQVAARVPEAAPANAAAPWRWVALLLAFAWAGTLALLLPRAGSLPPAGPPAALAPESPAAASAMPVTALRPADTGTAGPAALEAIEWALNQDLQPPPGTLLLGEAAAELLRGLLPRLDALGWQGRVHVLSHVGRFCRERDSFGESRLASPVMAITDCEGLERSEVELRLEGARQSLGFANAVAALGAEYGERIEVVLESVGAREPLEAYPLFAEGLVAGAWNAVAARNHRVEIRLEPAAGGALP